MNKIKKPHAKLPPVMFELLVVIVNRGRGEEVASYLKALRVNLSVISFGDGSAPSNLYNVLNYNQEKEIVFAVIKREDAVAILDAVAANFLSLEKKLGIAFTIPLKSITTETINTLKLLRRKK